MKTEKKDCMFMKQLSVFIENRQGRLEEVLKVLKEKKGLLAVLFMVFL